MTLVAVLFLVLTSIPAISSAQAIPLTQRPPELPPTIENLGDGVFRVGSVRTDTKAREISVAGTVNDVPILEWVANTKNGMKAYESALTLDTNAITFNTAALMIGLDKAHAKVPTRHFDPATPQGDPVELWVEWGNGEKRQRVRVEQMLFDRRTNATLPEGPWVYTGSTFIPNGGGYLAELDGVLIGFVHSPAPIVENPRAGAVGAYGAVVFNKSLGLAPNTPVTLTMKAIAAREKAAR